MKQRIYLPAEYAEILSRKAYAVGVSPDLYVQNLIVQDHICQDSRSANEQLDPPTETESVALSGPWADMSL